MAKLLARCHTLDDLGERFGGLTFEMDEKVKRPSQVATAENVFSRHFLMIFSGFFRIFSRFFQAEKGSFSIPTLVFSQLASRLSQYT